MSTTVTSVLTINITTCAGCGMAFGVTKDFERRRRDDHKTFYCPSGCHNWYSQDNETEAAKKELEREKRYNASLLSQLDQERAEVQMAKKAASVAKGQLTRERNRIAKGVCPCCNRSFPQLHEHMKTQHPDYTPPKD